MSVPRLQRLWSSESGTHAPASKRVNHQFFAGICHLTSWTLWRLISALVGLCKDRGMGGPLALVLNGVGRV